jgi:sterol desaturase/sphingolipid hydroxylase (fatty acid hydroxylase superfamily)
VSEPSLTWSSLSTIGAILAGMALLALVETAVPLHARGRDNRVHLGPNLALTFITFGTNVFLNAGLVLLLVQGQATGFGILPALNLHPMVAGGLAIVLLDFSFYVAHVAMHKVPALWRVHSVHHSDPVIDVTTTIRQHPIEGVIRYTFMAVAVCAGGVGVEAFMVYRVWSALSGLLEHANIRIPRWFDRMLVPLTTWPNMHKVHHSQSSSEADTNYGNIFPWFDWLLGTYTPSWRGTSVACGLDGYDAPALQTTTGLLALPFKKTTQAHETSACVH